MNGALLKTRLQSIEPNLAEAARKLNMSKQSFYQALEAVDVKSGLIERLASLYCRPVGFFFDDKIGNYGQMQYGGSNNSQVGGNVSNGINMAEHDELIRLREEVKFLKELMTDKDERISELKEIINLMKQR